jgi:hypothetical protein
MDGEIRCRYKILAGNLEGSVEKGDPSIVKKKLSM